MTRKQRRLSLIAVAGSVLTLSIGLMLYAISDTIVFFNTPTQMVENPPPADKNLRLGGLVKEGSIQRMNDVVRFVVSDGNAEIEVQFAGLLPDLFREGQGIVAEGRLGEDKIFAARTVLAKHDENYMPKEVADALKDQGVWKGDAYGN